MTKRKFYLFFPSFLSMGQSCKNFFLKQQIYVELVSSDRYCDFLAPCKVVKHGTYMVHWCSQIRRGWWGNQESSHGHKAFPAGEYYMPHCRVCHFHLWIWEKKDEIKKESSGRAIKDWKQCPPWPTWSLPMGQLDWEQLEGTPIFVKPSELHCSSRTVEHSLMDWTDLVTGWFFCTTLLMLNLFVKTALVSAI